MPSAADHGDGEMLGARPERPSPIFLVNKVAKIDNSLNFYTLEVESISLYISLLIIIKALLLFIARFIDPIPHILLLVHHLPLLGRLPTQLQLHNIGIRNPDNIFLHSLIVDLHEGTGTFFKACYRSARRLVKNCYIFRYFYL